MRKNTSRRFLSIALWAGAVGLWACQQDVALQGFDPNEGFDPDRRGRRENRTLASAFETTFRDSINTTGTRPFVSLGRFRGLEARVLLRFAPVPVGLEVIDAAILLRTNAVIGDKTQKTSFLATVHEITASWDDSTVTDENFQDAFDPMAIAAVEVRSVDRGADTSNVETVRIALDSLAVALVKDSTSLFRQNGVLLQAPNATFIKEFFSSNNDANIPQLQITVRSDTTDEDQSLFLDVVEDAFIVRELEPLPEGLLYLDNLFTNQVVLKFDFSDIPREAQINRADLRINLVDELSIIKSGGLRLENNGFALEMRRLLKEFDPNEAPELDNQLTVLGLVSTPENPVLLPGSQFAAVFRRYVQEWVNETTENHGMLVRAITPGFDVSRLVIRPTAQANKQGPALEIEFSVAPNFP